MIDQRPINFQCQREWFLKQVKKFYIIVANDCDIGYVNYDPTSKEVGICLLPKWRGKGYGVKAFSQLISQLLRPLHLRVLSSNERAKKIYEKLGFKVMQRQNNIIFMTLA